MKAIELRHYSGFPERDRACFFVYDIEKLNSMSDDKKILYDPPTFCVR